MAIPARDALGLGLLLDIGPLRPTDLTGALGLTSGGAAALVQRLEAAGHIVRERHPDDLRACLLTISDAAADALAGKYRSLAEDLHAVIARDLPRGAALLPIALRDVAEVMAIEVGRHSEQLQASARVHDPSDDEALWS